jgi:hypothetical protein
MSNMRDDQVLEALRRAKPSIGSDRTDPTAGQAQAIKRSIVAAPTGRKMRLFVPGAITGALAIALAAIIFTTGGGSPRRPSGAVKQPNMKLLAAASKDAFSTTGRATATFVLAKGKPQEERGTTTLTFAGNDLDMTIDFETIGYGERGFTAHNRTVDGEFYLFDGPPGDRHWYHDTNASGARADDGFDLDPRTLVDLLGSEPQFVTADSEIRDGEEVRHLVATQPDSVRDLNLGLGNGADTETKSLELWVGPDDVVRRLAVEVETSETHDTGTMYIKRKNGTVETIVDPDATPKTITYRSTYSVSFTDIGEDISIKAPSNAIDVAGKG